MLAGRALFTTSRRCKSYSTHRGLRTVPTLPDADLDTFRQHAFAPALPALFPQGSFNQLPAITKWFVTINDTPALRTAYLARFGSVIVPLEISNNDHFTRIEQSLSFFLECVQAASSTYRPPHTSRYFSSYVPFARAIRRSTQSNAFFSAAPITPPTARIYLAQAPIADLPQALKDDVPTPEVVLKVGKGDVYDSSIWLGQAPTYTPLHRDPNPNVFVQLAGRKVVRLYRPETGREIFAKAQEEIGGSASASMRGEEMMQGAEKRALEAAVWDARKAMKEAWEAELQAGDALFIPKGWWHSLKGVGKGMTGSVNWWFR
jgi:hypothetical protein